MPDLLQTLSFPALAFHSQYALLLKSPTALTTGWAYGLRHGAYSDLLIVDSKGRAVHAAGARKISGIGPLAGWTLFLNQRIKLEFRQDGQTALPPVLPGANLNLT